MSTGSVSHQSPNQSPSSTPYQNPNQNPISIQSPSPSSSSATHQDPNQNPISIPNPSPSSTPHQNQLDPSAIWWSDPRYPALSPVFALPMWPAPRHPRVGLSVALFVGSFLFPLLGSACWWLGRTELRGIEGGTVIPESRSWLAFVQVWGAFWTFLLVPLLLMILAGR
jgi:hypothetical protein